ncbi:ABC transporter ATP-binding protein [Rhodocyclus tenuis]|uniref:ABC transporter ATP-binding protein n=1 Tax=Rhodocyclus gracilis TaxID=2929842 RepID=A0ABX0WJ61_9RHOO|nr:ABC transporter ATP-binding protein [Rhodocyclus gracilis]MRD72307.1 ATP-binding cassette domain-containing protein [Rhodocyclus gracilis]NJA89604.1 ABC transporter ATP-binding protein [Rhodocyclus gracilis]
MNQLFADVLRLFPRKAVALLLLASFASISEGFLLILLLPLIGALTGSPATSGVAYKVIQFCAVLGVPDTASAYAVLFLVFSLAQYSLVLIQAALSSQLQAIYVRSIREDIFASLLSARWDFLVEIRSAEYLSGLITEAAHASLALTYFVTFVSSAITALVYFLIAFNLSSLLTTVLGITFVVAGSATYLASKRASLVGRETCEYEARSAQWLSEVLGSLKSYKAAAWEEIAIRKYSALNFRLSRLVAVALRSPQFVRVAMEFFALVGLILMLYIGATDLKISFSVLLVLLGAFIRTYPRLISAQQAFQLLSLHLQSVRRVRNLITLATVQSEKAGGLKFSSKSNGVDIDCINLSVSAGGDRIVNDVSIKIPACQYVAIVGPSGSGKTTLVDCLLGLRQVETGKILIDGHPLKEIDLLSWRKRVAYVSQDPPIFNASVRDNIIWGRSDVSDDEVVRAAKAAHAHDFICQLEHGYETYVGDWGGKLSGGQKQRIAIARALISKSVLLVLDEATSALDSQSEREVMNALDDLKGGLSIIAIAHRLSTVRSADRILVMESGRIAESGTWLELIEERGLFARLVSLQGQG